MKQDKKPWERFAVEEGLWKRVLKWEEEPVLTLTLKYPKLPEGSPGLRRVGRYYRQVADHWKSRWEGVLYCQAKEAAAAARAASRPFQPWEAMLTYTVTYQQDGLFSLYMDSYEYAGGAHGLTVRRGDVWELPSGTPRSLRSFFPPKCHWRKHILATVAEQIQARNATGNYQFDPQWPRTVESCFDPERFYLTEEGLVVFYPLYAIAPYVEGIPTFTIPLPQQTAPNGQPDEIDQKNPLKR